MLYIFYEKDNYEKTKIELAYNGTNSSTFDLDLVNADTVNYRIDNSGEYNIFFGLMSNYKINIIIVSSEFEFSIDINKELFFYNFSSFEEEEESTNFNTQIKFNITNTDKDYYKLFSTENLDAVISYNENDKEFVPMTSPVFLFKKGESIRFIIYTKNITEFARISNLKESYITDLSFGSFEYEVPTTKIFKIDYFKTPYFKLEGIKSHNYYIAYADEEQFKNVGKNFEKLSFNSYKENSFPKPYYFYYAILVAEFFNNGTLNIEQMENPTNSLGYNSEQIFNSFKNLYHFEIPELENKKKLLFIFKTNDDFSIKINGPDNYEKNETFTKTNGVEGFALEKSDNGSYNIKFSSENKFEGIFMISDFSKELNMDIKDKIKLNSFSMDYKPEPLVIVFNTENITEDIVYKKITIGEEDTFLNLIKIGHNKEEEDYKNLNMNY